MMDPYRDDPIEEDQPSVAGGIGAAYVGRPDERDMGNDQEDHVSPPDNDGETVPQDEVVDRASG